MEKSLWLQLPFTIGRRKAVRLQHTFPFAVNSSRCLWKQKCAFISLLDLQQDKFNSKVMKGRRCRRQISVCHPRCARPLRFTVAKEGLIFYSRQTRLVQNWCFPGDAVALSPEQTLFCFKKELYPVYNASSFVRLGLVKYGPMEQENGITPSCGCTGWWCMATAQVKASYF